MLAHPLSCFILLLALLATGCPPCGADSTALSDSGTGQDAGVVPGSGDAGGAGDAGSDSGQPDGAVACFAGPTLDVTQVLFPTQPLGCAVARATVCIQNPCAAPVAIAVALSGSAAFGLEGAPPSLVPAEGSACLVVTYDAATPGSQEAALEMTSDSTVVAIPLAGSTVSLDPACPGLSGVYLTEPGGGTDCFPSEVGGSIVTDDTGALTITGELATVMGSVGENWSPACLCCKINATTTNCRSTGGGRASGTPGGRYRWDWECTVDGVDCTLRTVLMSHDLCADPFAVPPGDGGTPDSGTPDSGTSDGGVSDGGVSDGGVSDGGVSDGGVSDGGSPLCTYGSTTVSRNDLMWSDLDDYCRWSSCPPDLCQVVCASGGGGCGLECVALGCIGLSVDCCPPDFCQVLDTCDGTERCWYRSSGPPPTCGVPGYFGQSVDCCAGAARECGDPTSPACAYWGRGYGNLPICLACGDGECEAIENPCNCPVDCTE